MPYGMSHFLKEKSYSEETILTYAAIVKSFLAYINKSANTDYDINSINRQDILNYLNHLEKDKQLAISTCNRNLTALKIFFDYAEKFELVLRDPTIKIKTRPTPKMKTQPYNYNEWTKHKNEVYHSVNLTVVDKAIYALSLFGLSTSQYKIQKEAVHFDKSAAKVTIDLNRRKWETATRTIVLENNEADVFLAAYYESLLIDCNCVFVSKKNSSEYIPIYTETIYRTIPKICHVLGLSKIRPTDLRHMYIMHLYQDLGAKIEEIAQELGIKESGVALTIKENLERISYT